MNKRNTLLAVIISVIFILHIANALYQGKILPNCARTFDEGMNTDTLQFIHPIDTSSEYPPLYRFNCYLIKKLTGNNWTFIYVFNNSIYFLLLLIFLYLLGKAVKDTETGLLSALIVSLYPLVTAGYNRYCMDFALLSLIIIFLLFLYRSDYFLNAGYSVLAGITVVYGVMLKESFPAFIAGPVLYVFYLSLKDVFKRSFRRLITISIIFISAAAAAVSYFGLKHFYYLFWQCILLETTGKAWSSFDNLRLFWIGLWESQLSIPFFFVLIPGIYYFIKEKDTRFKITVFSSIIVPNLLMIFMPHWKSERYIMPQLSVLAFISAFGLRKIIESSWGKIVIAFLIIAGILQVYDLTYDKIGLSKLQYKGLYYWNPEYMELSVNTKLDRTKTCVNISQVLLSNIIETEHSGIKKNNYKILIFPGRPLDGALTLHSYFLLNSDKDVRIKRLFDLVKDLNINGAKQIDVDYVLQVAVKGSKRESIYDLDIFKKAVNQIIKENINNDPGPAGLDILGNKWLNYLKNFKDCGLIYSNSKDDFYLYQYNSNLN
ncbi:MAG: glycosyltransferase family 39 protein [Elusimicrobia bacterium]|nr:glycosyltransferase family 39 protein [Candidatus Liberimonas magnetica]